MYARSPVAPKKHKLIRLPGIDRLCTAFNGAGSIGSLRRSAQERAVWMVLRKLQLVAKVETGYRKSVSLGLPRQRWT